MAKVYFSLGDHDFDIPANYENKIGYLDKAIIRSSCNFVLFNSSKSIQNINIVLEDALVDIGTSNPVELF